ncbi:ribokinase [Micromonospora pattaloongensis]|uniref:Ribokinase n=1 Tax=Micromonospora pattaloongensis TaxID=405436 RepID=A0A1H3RU86_9ACTN|nr:PfkB family carbohydrate kinase [Micromonospora pattaloongensis]SDZ28895.1 ribokinase [Micromonospora pattaloongensis]
MSQPPVMVVGQLVRDLVLVVDDVPRPLTAATVRLRREMLGGKGANQAVSLAQLGVPVGLVAVAGDDRVGDDMLARAMRDGIDVTAVVRRPETDTGLIVDVVDAHHHWRYLEHVPEPVLLTEADVAAAAPRLAAAPAVLVQLQQPPAAALRAARLATGLVVLDGAPPDEHRAELLAAADVVRADARETAGLLGAAAEDPERAVAAARELLDAGPSLVAVALDPRGNLFVWRGGQLLVPFTDTPIVDTTGAGDALTAGLTTGLIRGEGPERAAVLAAAAASATVGHPGGRPDLNPSTLRAHLALVEKGLRR